MTQEPKDLTQATVEDLQWQTEERNCLTLIEALSVARASAAELTGLPIDGIASTESTGDGGWRILVDVLEGAARIGDNDLLASYRIDVGADGALVGFSRQRRYRREEGGVE